jgi:hypothetical protein
MAKRVGILVGLLFAVGLLIVPMALAGVPKVVVGEMYGATW